MYNCRKLYKFGKEYVNIFDNNDKLSSYEYFADYYDLFMQDTNYDDWIFYLKNIFKKYNFSPNTVLDLGCGTGTVTKKLEDLGIDMIGIDNSIQMLNNARKKSSKTLLLHQSLDELDLYDTVDCAISLCDTINYILNKESLLKAFKLVNTFLNPKGLFIFDINTEYKFLHVLNNNSYSKIFDEAVCTWENTYDEYEKIMEYYTVFFVKQKNNLYKRFEEFHYEYAYSCDEISDLIMKSGLEILDIYDAYTFNKPKKTSQRIFFVTREKNKN